MPAGRHRARKNFPLSAACNDDWEKECQQIASEQLGKKVAKSLNGQRFTAWRLCVERKRRELLYMLGAGNVPLAQMPEDIKGKVLEFLPAAPSGRDEKAIKSTDIAEKMKEMRLLAAEKWAGLMSQAISDEAKEECSLLANNYKKHFFKDFLTKENAGDTYALAENMRDWFDMPELQTKLEGLGYNVHVMEESIVLHANDLLAYRQ